MSAENILFMSEDNKFHKLLPLAECSLPPRVGDTVKFTEDNIETTYQVIRVIITIPALPFINIIIRKK